MSGVLHETNFLPLFLGYRLKDSILRVTRAKDELTCAHHCLLGKKPKCESFNFIDDPGQNCKLNLKVPQVAIDASLVPHTKASFFNKIKTGRTLIFSKTGI